MMNLYFNVFDMYIQNKIYFYNLKIKTLVSIPIALNTVKCQIMYPTILRQEGA